MQEKIKFRSEIAAFQDMLDIPADIDRFHRIMMERDISLILRDPVRQIGIARQFRRCDQTVRQIGPRKTDQELLVIICS